MEAAAIGVANTALNSVVKTAIKTITNEIGLLLGVQDELFFIKEELEMMQGFLQAASAEKEKSVVVTIWAKQVQELAFDVEDCLQEASLHLMKKSCLPIMCSAKKRGHIVKKIRMLKTRIDDVSKRNIRYKLSEGHDGHTYNESGSTKSITNVKALLVGLEEPKKKLVDLILEEDVEPGDNPWKGKVISVVGMGGLGKTTLVREVFGCQELSNEFNHFAWVTIQHPFNKEAFIESLAKQIPPNPNENNENKSEPVSPKTTEEMIIEYLKTKKYLTVLDDLSSVVEWDKIKDVFPRVDGSRIIVTTRYRRPLAEYISDPSDNIYDIRKLSEKDALDLFFKAVYKTPNYSIVIDHRKMKDDPPDESNGDIKNVTSSTVIIEENSEVQKECITITITEDMKTEAGLIIESCDRLPLAIVTIGSYLATKPKTSSEWMEMRKKLSSELTNNPDLGMVKTVLTSGYDGMPYHLKPSLLYLSVFHNHKEIRRSRIIRRWMADGYVMEGRKRTAEEVGKGYFYDLMGRNLIQPSQMGTIVNGEVKKCNIHDIMHELIVSKAMDENMISLLEDEKLITMTDKVRHLVITGGPCKDDKVLEKVKLSHMRSLSIFGEVRASLRYSKMKLLRVLDLEGTLDFNNRDLRSVGKLRHLKYLGLRGTKIRELPNSLGKLSELETLDIRNTAVFRLPTTVTKLNKLSYLSAGFLSFNNSNNVMKMIDPRCIAIRVAFRLLLISVLSICPICCPGKGDATVFRRPVRSNSYGVRVPHGIGELRSLNILGTIDIRKSKSLANELQNLTNLIKLAVTGFSEENGKILAKVIDGLKYLRSLVLSAEDGTSGLGSCLGSVSSPPKYLRSLKLYSPLGKLPKWISYLENLEKIYLRNTKLTGVNEAIEAIEKLPNLKILYLLDSSFEDVKELCFGEGIFPMLQVFILEAEVKSVSIEKAAFKRLEQLKIRECEDIRKGGVSGLEFLEHLKEMEVVGHYNNVSGRELVRNIKEQLKKLPKEPVFRVMKE